MAARLKRSFDDLVGEVETRKSRERELKESEARLRVSEERLQLAISTGRRSASWDWNIEQDRLVGTTHVPGSTAFSDEFSGAFESWSQ